MSQYGMQMPGGQLKRGPSLTVYTGLLFLAVVCLIAACAMVYLQGQKIGHNGDPMSLHPAERDGSFDIRLRDPR